MDYGAEKAEDGNWETRFGVSSDFSSDEGNLTEEEFTKLLLDYEKLPPLILTEDINYCKNYTAGNYDTLLPPDKRGYFSDITLEELSYYVRDLNLDGRAEIITVSWEHSPLFVFEYSPDGLVFNSIVGRNKIRSYLTEENFESLADFDNGDEKYCYYYYETDYAFSDITRNMVAIKYDKETNAYYTEFCLSYGTESPGNGQWTMFFRKKELKEVGGGYETEELSCEEFIALWNKYEELPPVSFVDINDKLFRDYERERHNVVFDFDSYGYDFYAAGDSYVIDGSGNVTDLNGGTEWKTDEFGIAGAMSELADNKLEYMGEVEWYHYGDIVNISDGKAYRYTDPVKHNAYLLVIWNTDTENTGIFGTAMFKRCQGYHYEEYPEFDIQKIPELSDIRYPNITVE